MHTLFARFGCCASLLVVVACATPVNAPTSEGVTMSWPADGDGDVFRRMQRSGFNFSKPQLVDYNVDFKAWPPPSEAVSLLRRHHPDLKLYPPEGDSGGYIQVTQRELVTYERVVSTKRQLTLQMEPFGGVCKSWGVLQE